jgi:ABC-type transport system involved in multi-copper enzyme maturation permease subunit
MRRQQQNTDSLSSVQPDTPLLHTHFWALLQWRFAQNVRSLRFAFALAIAALLGLSSGYFESRRYQNQLVEFKSITESYQNRIRQAETICELLPLAVNLPSPSSALARGTAGMFGATAVLPGVFGSPIIWNPYSLDNPFLHFSVSGGFAPISMAVFVLISFLFTFGSVAGAPRSGALRLILSFGVSRRVYLAAEFVGCVVTILIPLLVGLACLAASMRLENTHLELVSQAAVAYLILGLLTLSAAAWLGLLISSASMNPRSSLISLVFAWSVLVWLWPTFTAQGARIVYPTPADVEVKVPVPSGTDSLLLSSLPTSPPAEATSSSRRHPAAIYSRYLSLATDPNRHEALAHQYETAARFGYLSFLTAFDYGMYAACGVSATDQTRFESFCRAENRRIAQWQRDMIKANPRRFYVRTNLDTALVVHSQDYVIASNVDMRFNSEVLVAGVVLLAWTLLFATAAVVVFENRSITNLP